MACASSEDSDQPGHLHSNQQNMHLFQLGIITISCHAFYFTENGTLLCDVNVTLILQGKMGNFFFLEQHIL